MTATWTGPAAIASLILMAAGGAKVRNPHHLGFSPALIRVGAAAEFAVGGLAVAFGGLAVALVAVSYVAFAAWVGVAMARRVPLRSCGCFGEPDTPPSAFHVVIDLALAVVAAAAYRSEALTAADALAFQPMFGVPFVALVVLGTMSGILALVWLPRLATAGR